MVVLVFCIGKECHTMKLVLEQMEKYVIYDCCSLQDQYICVYGVTGKTHKTISPKADYWQQHENVLKYVGDLHKNACNRGDKVIVMTDANSHCDIRDTDNTNNYVREDGLAMFLSLTCNALTRCGKGTRIFLCVILTRGVDGRIIQLRSVG